MTVVILQYVTGTVKIIHVSKTYLDTAYDGDLESYLAKECDYDENQDYYMCGVERFEIIEPED